MLLVQGVLSARLIWANTAFIDEGAYIFAGYQEYAHLVHGQNVATYETFFSGAPVIYPVLVAIADMAGSLEGARLLSLVFMLSATVALYLTTRRLFDRMSAFFAAALFASLGPTQFLGGFATYDAMALAVLVWAAYFSTRFAFGGGRPALAAAAVLLALANLTKYASLLWNPVVVALAVLAGPGYAVYRRARWKNGLLLVAGWCVAVAGPVLLAGDLYLQGFKKTTLMRKPAHDTVSYLLEESGEWIGALVLLALIGVVVAFAGARGRGPQARVQAWLMLVLFLGGIAAPVNQMRIHTWLSLQKHVDFGAWFACVVAGALLARAVRSVVEAKWMPGEAATALVVLLAVVPMTWVGAGQGSYMTGAWPNSKPMVDLIRPYVQKGTADYLVEDYNVAAYYLKDRSNWYQWHDLVAINYTDPSTGRALTGVPGFKAAVKNRKYSLIVLDYAQTRATDRAVEPVIREAGYRLLATIETSNTATHGAYYVYLSPDVAEIPR
ncbi:glycosyltransferase family 39 protein [Kitasatospora sp. NPDC088134]|uniref:glycosyltransferase family 39 protein n=1 Tax=Kitasatospora sp. NPDC088134 TaxID=3364071 RepID=UPI0038041DD7